MKRYISYLMPVTVVAAMTVIAIHVISKPHQNAKTPPKPSATVIASHKETIPNPGAHAPLLQREDWIMQRQPKSIDAKWIRWGRPPLYFSGGDYYFEVPGQNKYSLSGEVLLHSVPITINTPNWVDFPLIVYPRHKS